MSTVFKCKQALPILLFVFLLFSGCTKQEKKPILSIGAVQKPFYTGALCIFTYQNKKVAIAEKDVWMHLNGKDIQLKQIPGRAGAFKAEDTTITFDEGPAEDALKPGEIGMDGTIYNHATITFLKNGQSFKIKVKGDCG